MKKPKWLGELTRYESRWSCRQTIPWLRAAKIRRALKSRTGHWGSNGMPHYFFNLTDDKIIHDFKGKQLRDLKQAREHALIIAREVVNTKATLLREPISDWSIIVKDGKFQKLFSIPITDAMPQPE